jgi:hypothetical protein
MTTRPVGAIRFARAELTGPDGLKVDGQVTVAGGTVEVVARRGDFSASLPVADVVRIGRNAYRITGENGLTYELRRLGGGCGCGR